MVLRATHVGSGFSTPVGGASGAADPLFVQSMPVARGAWNVTRVRRNVRTMGILWVCFGVYRLVSGFVELAVLRGLARGSGFGQRFPFGPGFHMPQMPWMVDFLPVILVGVAMSSVLAIVTGLALLKRASWARVLAIIVAVLALIKFPLGTALGVYTLYVLAPRVSAMEWEEMTTVGQT